MRTSIRHPRSASPVERSSALVLVPTMLLVLIALGAVALDLTAQHGAQRAVHRVATTAADDAAAMIDTRQVQVDGTIRIDADAAQRVARAQVATARLPGPLAGPVRVEVADDGSTVTVRLAVRVPPLLLSSQRGGDALVAATVTARVRP